MHYDRKSYEVVSLEEDGYKALNGNWNNAVTVVASDYSDAASIWAEQFGDSSIIRQGSYGPVLVREMGSEAYKTFMIDAKTEIYYYAREK